MKIRTVMLFILVALLLLGATVQAQSSRWCVVEPGLASGGRYRLTTLSWDVSGTVAGGGYRLLAPAAPTLGGSGCCCTYLPVVLRNAP
jgi:hypothetical protein